VWYRQLERLTCELGLDHIAYKFILDNNQGKVATEASYPQLDQVGFCHFDLKRGRIADGAHEQIKAPVMTNAVHVTEAHRFENSSVQFHQEDLVKAFNLRLHTNGPLAVNVDITKEFFFYKSGVYSNAECKNDAPSLDHGMLAVGFDLDAPIPFTLVRNSWGAVWGEGGFARIAQKGNTCGVATAATYVKVGNAPA